jgi:hypothetical protein
VRQCCVYYAYTNFPVPPSKDEDQRAGGLGFDAKVPSIQSPDLTIEKFLSKSPIDILLAGEQNNVPLIMGANRHDGSFAFEDIYNKYLKSMIDDEEWTRNELLPQLIKAMSKSGGKFQNSN